MYFGIPQVIFFSFGIALVFGSFSRSFSDDKNFKGPQPDPLAASLQCYFLGRLSSDPILKNPELLRNKASCREVLDHLKHESIKWRTPAIQAFNVIFNILKNIKHDTTEDKSIFYALNVILNYFRNPHPNAVAPPLLLHLLTACRIEETGRTLLMEIITQGLPRSLEHPLAIQMIRQPSFTSQRDKSNNSVLHLAVLSKNLMIFNHIMRNLILDKPEDYLSLFELTNKNHFTPLSLAFHLHYHDIVHSLRNHHHVYNILRHHPLPTDLSHTSLSASDSSSLPTEVSLSSSSSALFLSLNQSNVLWNSPLIVALRVMVYGVLGHLNLSTSLDNTVVRALTVLSYHASRPTNFSLLRVLESFKNCVLDTQGNTFLMLCVRLGLAETLISNSDFFTSQWEAFDTFYDHKRNNIIHLAVESRNPQIVMTVLERIQWFSHLTKRQTTDRKHHYMLDMLKQRNHEGLTPVEMAITYGSMSIIQTLQAHYTVYEEDSRLSLSSSSSSMIDSNTTKTTCQSVLSNIRQMTSLYHSPIVTAFRIIGLQLSTPNHSTRLNLDKLVCQSLSVIADHCSLFSKNVFSNLLLTQLKDCFWTSENENIFMMAIRLGLIDALNSPYFQFIKAAQPLYSLYNSKKENIIHLAVRSGNADVVLRILSLLHLENANIITMLKDRAANGLNPKELAIQHRSDCIADILSAHYNTFKLYNSF